MKDEIVSCVIFAMLIALFVFNSYVVNNRCHGLTSHIEKAESILKSGGDARKDMETIYKKWNREKKALFYLCGHSLIKEVDENIILGREYLREEDSARAARHLRKARIILDDLSDREKIKLDNIF